MKILITPAMWRRIEQKGDVGLKCDNTVKTEHIKPYEIFKRKKHTDNI